MSTGWHKKTITGKKRDGNEEKRRERRMESEVRRRGRKR